MDENIRKVKATTSVEGLSKALAVGDLNDLCDSTDAVIESDGGFRWIKPPLRDTLERYWQGVITMPSRTLFVARLDGVVCGGVVLVRPERNNEIRRFSADIRSLFIAPWARHYGLADELMKQAEAMAKEEGFEAINIDVQETQENAIRLFERRGYVRIGTHPFYAKIRAKVIKGCYYYKLISPQKSNEAS